MDLYKECSKCKTNLNIIEFHNCKGGKFGKHSICKLCRKVKKELSIPITDYKLCPKCNTIMNKGADPGYYNQFGHCFKCFKKFETNNHNII